MIKYIKTEGVTNLSYQLTKPCDDHNLRFHLEMIRSAKYIECFRFDFFYLLYG